MILSDLLQHVFEGPDRGAALGAAPVPHGVAHAADARPAADRLVVAVGVDGVLVIGQVEVDVAQLEHL